MAAGPDAPGSFFGRRKGKALRPGHEALLRDLLPRLRIALPEAGPLDPPTLFPAAVAAVELEIGFGGGEHLARQACANPGTGFIGVEPFVNGVAKLLAAVEAETLGNVRLWDADAAHLLPRLRAGSIARAYILYPDPWPKRRQRKRRFLSDDNLALLSRALRLGGELRFATDIDDYAGFVLARVARSPDLVWSASRPADWREPWPGWEPTRYEAKALREGRRASYLTFRRS